MPALADIGYKCVLSFYRLDGRFGYSEFAADRVSCLVGLCEIVCKGCCGRVFRLFKHIRHHPGVRHAPSIAPCPEAFDAVRPIKVHAACLVQHLAFEEQCVVLLVRNARARVCGINRQVGHLIDRFAVTVAQLCIPNRHTEESRVKSTWVVLTPQGNKLSFQLVRDDVFITRKNQSRMVAHEAQPCFTKSPVHHGQQLCAPGRI